MPANMKQQPFLFAGHCTKNRRLHTTYFVTDSAFRHNLGANHCRCLTTTHYCLNSISSAKSIHSFLQEQTITFKLAIGLPMAVFNCTLSFLTDPIVHVRLLESFNPGVLLLCFKA